MRKTPLSPRPKSLPHRGGRDFQPDKAGLGPTTPFFSPSRPCGGRGRGWGGIPLLLAALLSCALPGAASAQTGTATPNHTTFQGCPVFPDDNAWNQDVSQLPLDPNSARYIAAINGSGDTHLHADFGSDPDHGIPFIAVSGSQPKVPINFTEYGDESDPGPYPVPPNAPVEAGDDHHVLVVDTENCVLYELYHA